MPRIIFIFSLILLLTSHESISQETTRPVKLNGELLFELVGQNPIEAKERSVKVERRLEDMLSKNAPVYQPRIIKSGEERIIFVGSAKIVSVTPLDAEENLTDVEILSEKWAKIIYSNLSQARSTNSNIAHRLTVEIKNSISSAVSRLLEAGIKVIPQLLAALIVITFFWLLALALRYIMRLFFRRFVKDLTIENLIKQITYYSVWFIGFIIAGEALGFEAQTVVTGLGLTSLALGFALKDIISNFVSGIIILLFRPFKLNDQIAIGPTEGSVEKIELRATHIRSYDGRLNLVPNQDLLTSRVINNTASPIRRGRETFYLGYSTSLNEILDILKNELLITDGILSNPQANVRLGEPGTADITLEAIFWTDSRRSDFVSTSALVRKNLIAKLQELQAPLPDPSLRIVKQQDKQNFD